MVERQLPKLEVAGSKPVVRSICRFQVFASALCNVMEDLPERYCVVRCFDVTMRVDNEKSGEDPPPHEEKEQRECLGRQLYWLLW